jgi:hypothetical protein
VEKLTDDSSEVILPDQRRVLWEDMYLAPYVFSDDFLDAVANDLLGLKPDLELKQQFWKILSQFQADW